MNGAYPRGSDLKAFLLAAGIATEAPLEPLLEIAAQDGRQEFERRARRVFLAVTGTRYFDPPTTWQGVLAIDDLAGPPTAVTYTPNGGATDTYVLGTDYVLEPANAPAKGWPYRFARFVRRRWWEPLSPAQFQSLAITGPWGYGPAIPAPVWTAMLARAAWKLHGVVAANQAGALVSFTEAGVSETYSADPLGYLRKAWAGDDGTGGIFGAAVSAYERVEI